MRIQIRTVYNSENCGSFLQAYALGVTLRGMGHDAVYLKRPVAGTSHGPVVLAKNCAKSLLKGDLSAIPWALRTHAAFTRSSSALEVESHSANAYDAIVLGSDTIWQLEHGYFSRNKRRFWAMDADPAQTRIVAYAPSIANTAPEIIGDDPDVINALDSIYALGVRDGYTRQILQPLTRYPIVEVCDPTILLQADDYRRISKTVDSGRYLFAYYSDARFPAGLAEAVGLLAASEGLRVVSYLGAPFPAELRARRVDPCEFLGLMDGASYVVTNTFHGAIFSQLLNKQTVFCSTGKKKVTDLLEKLGIADHDWDTADERGDLFHAPFDFDDVNARLADMRGRSLAFLEAALGDVRP